MKHWRFANRESIRVFVSNNHIVAIVSGKKPKQCGGPQLAQLPSGRWGLRCECAEECIHRSVSDDDYFIVQPLADVGDRSQIAVIHRDGCDELKLESISMVAAPSSDCGILGISQDFSLEAAFKDALAKIGPEPDRTPGLVEVVSMGALYGGFSGFSRLFVRLEKTDSYQLATKRMGLKS